MQLPRILFTAPSSASGKTTVTCGILPSAYQPRTIRFFF